MEQLDAKILERGLAAKPNSVPPIDAAMLRVHRVRFFKGEINSDTRGSQKYHVTVGHQTVMASVCFMELPGSSKGYETTATEADAPARPMTPGGAAADRPMTPAEIDDASQQSKDAQIARLAKLDESEGGEAAEAAAAELSEAFEPFDFDREYEFLPTLERRGPKSGFGTGPVWALFEFDTPIFAPVGSRAIASRLDFDVHTTECRVAFHGTILSKLPKRSAHVDRSDIKVYKLKQKFGTIDHIHDDKTIVGKDLFKAETDLTIYRGLKVLRGPPGSSGRVGVIDGQFGLTGKFRVYFKEGGLLKQQQQRAAAPQPKEEEEDNDDDEEDEAAPEPELEPEPEPEPEGERVVAEISCPTADWTYRMLAAKLRVVIGRSSKTIDAESPDIQLENDKSISRQHFAVVVDPELGTACLEVLAKKGVTVNGVRSTPEDPKPTVATGDIIVAGKTTIVITLKEGTKAAQAKQEVRLCLDSTIRHTQLQFMHTACDMECLTRVRTSITGGGEEEKEEAEKTPQARRRCGWERRAKNAHLRVQEVHLRSRRERKGGFRAVNGWNTSRRSVVDRSISRLR